ncbi:zinc finger and BTB domain-containing protein 25 [Bombina bombina]|uniref:zinc finger and BTB domain-containing protein 25 n=1 Tax=Bombina bombina TaxID=8345 RepID=UPI00235ADD1F|nr:zinc finger and BTB domain-containing protein 25 [Bombina bombina]XP_053553253.1 zinc finger and BTB domain-containing protein 25 [Bombina bombina]
MDSSSHSLLLLQQLNMQREFGFLCDCTVAIGDVYFKAHRPVLAAFSNYFKMIFIHQSSECIKIQPADIQPDVFSYLLHVMYTGKSPKQSVDHIRLEDGIRFLHANILSNSSHETSQVLASEIIHSNLYGIQISTAHSTPKETVNVTDKASNTVRSSAQGEHPHLQLSLAIGLEDVDQQQQRAHFHEQGGAPGKAMEEIHHNIKQEMCESEAVRSPHGSLPSSEDTEVAFPKTGSRMHSCHYCGECFESRIHLKEHLHIHVSQALPFGVPASILESDDLGEVRPILENIENMEGYRLSNCLLNRSEEPPQHASRQEQLQLSQVSFLSKDSDPIELNCNFSFLRKRKLSCTLCGHSFVRRNQLLDHMYSHKLSRSHKPGDQAEQTVSAYCSSLVENSQKCSDTSQLYSGEWDPPQEAVEAVLVE